MSNFKCQCGIRSRSNDAIIQTHVVRLTGEREMYLIRLDLRFCVFNSEVVGRTSSCQEQTGPARVRSTVMPSFF